MNNLYLNSYQLYVLHLFNLEDNDIYSISYNSIKDKNGTALIDITLVNHPIPCPNCGFDSPSIKEYVKKGITHSALSDRNCKIIYHARRYKCPVCGRTYYEKNPFVFNSQKISIKTIFNILEDLKDFNETFTSVAKRHNVSPTSTASIFDAHVDIPRKPLPTHICVDEVFAFKSKESKYVCVILDYKTHEVIDVLPSRHLRYLSDYFYKIPLEERENVEFISYDMWSPYKRIGKTFFPKSLGVVDHYHVIQDLHRRLDKIRINVMKSFRKGTDGYYLLKKFNWMIFKNNDSDLFDPNAKRKLNHQFKTELNYHDIYLKLRDVHPRLAAVWALRDDVVDFYENCTYENAMENLLVIIKKFHECDIEEMRQFGDTLFKWRKEIVNSFIVVAHSYKVDKETGEIIYSAKKMNNGIIENRNKIIKCVKNNANGYTNWKRFRNRLLYVLNKDATFSLNPRPKEKKQDEKKEGGENNASV